MLLFLLLIVPGIVIYVHTLKWVVFSCSIQFLLVTQMSCPPKMLLILKVVNIDPKKWHCLKGYNLQSLAAG